MAGFWGRHMGLIDLLLEIDADGNWSIVSHTVRSAPDLRARRRQGHADRRDPTPRSSPAVDDRTRGDARICPPPVGETAAPLHSYFALVADDPSVQIVNIAQTWYLEQMMKGTEWEGLPILSAAAPVQGRRPWRSGLLHRRPGRPGRHQERRRSLPLPQHHPGGGDHRRGRQGTGSSARPASSTRSSPAQPTSR